MIRQRNSITKLRWFQYRLRSLLVLMTLSAFFCSWHAWEMRNAAERRSAIEKVIELGWDVRYYEAGFVNPNAPGEPPRWYWWLRKVHGDEYLGNCLWVEARQLTDAELVHLKVLTKLEYLDLQGSHLTDAGLVHLKGLPKLESLDLR